MTLELPVPLLTILTKNFGQKRTGVTNFRFLCGPKIFYHGKSELRYNICPQVQYYSQYSYRARTQKECRSFEYSLPPLSILPKHTAQIQSVKDLLLQLTSTIMVRTDTFVSRLLLNIQCNNRSTIITLSNNE